VYQFLAVPMEMPVPAEVMPGLPHGNPWNLSPAAAFAQHDLSQSAGRLPRAPRHLISQKLAD